MEKVVIMGNNGRVLLPAAYRKALHLEAGAAVILKFEKDHLTISSVQAAGKAVQDYVKKHSQESQGSAVAELKAMRKEEFERE
ncbi:MAG: AbrB/MazE/SpoVT family DNA-binding domain-containing protein [Gammaproteobacteria bacterium]|nr:AbrB/MazE/SpoVT family DNA-binding domain-containing protein [Gammaproteobacteria bacterium]